jgi:hypothetical protein
MTPIRARNHLALVVVLWLIQIATALVVIWPLARLVRSTYGSHPLGDRVLFADGAAELGDFVMRALPLSASALTAHLVIVIPIAFAIELVAFGATLTTLAFAFEGPPRARARAAIARALPSSVALGGQAVAMLVLQGASLGVAAAVFGAVADAIALRYGMPTADRLGVLLALPFVLFALALGAVRDVAAVRVVADESGALAAVLGAFGLVARRPILLVEYAWRGLVGIALLVVAAMVGTKLGGRLGGALFVLILLHQLVLGLRIGLRVSWLAAAIRRTRTRG